MNEIPKSIKPPHPASYYYSTILPSFDFETYSEAGQVLNIRTFKWSPLPNSRYKGLKSVSAPAYSEHPSTDILSFAYDLNDNKGPRVWTYGNNEPTELFDYIKKGGLIEAWNSLFEFFIWKNVCHKEMGWPELKLSQLRDAAAKARAFGLPGKLENAGKALSLEVQKESDGRRLIKKFSNPRNATKNNKTLRTNLNDDLEDASNLLQYNIRDIQAQSAISRTIPDLQPDELELWKLDQIINVRGVYIDVESLNNCISIVEQGIKKYTQELSLITKGEVDSANKIDKMKKWLESSQGLTVDSLKAEIVELMLDGFNLTPQARRVLEIRSILSSASVKKTFALHRTVSKDNRLRNLFVFCGAHTGRFTAKGFQPQNLPGSGAKITQCIECKKHYGINNKIRCPWCSCNQGPVKVEWCVEAVEDVLTCVATKSLETLELFFGDPFLAISGCLRGLLYSPPGYEMICSDFSAIEAVVLAEISGEQWRIDVFRTHGKIYEMSASQITGVPFEKFEEHKLKTGNHHELRKKVGKVAELASGYGGGLRAWQRFGADEYFKSEDEIKDAVIKWRKASPKIVDLWYALERCAKFAILSPGKTFEYHGISYVVVDDVLLCKLLSGRVLAYHQPRLVHETRWGKKTLRITYMGENKDSTQGKQGWVRMSTWGGKLTENVIQGIARDLLANSMRNIEGDTYQIVLHVHDEIAAYVPENEGSIEEFEQIMSTMPSWCADWPVKASGGWRGKRYRKE